MNLTDITISIIIPTHGRGHRIMHILEHLGLQTFPAEYLEVIVLVNNNADMAVTMLQSYMAPFKLIIREMSEKELVIVRNKGAALATGSLLIFIDDHVLPSERFVEAHWNAHQNKTDAVVIGWLSLHMPAKPGYGQIEQYTSQEEKFQKMSRPGYRFSYRDLLVSNFSVSTGLFKRAQGFPTGLGYHNDYELGLRYINIGADFIFSKNAWGELKEEKADIHRSLKWKREEGGYEVKMWQMYPGMIIPPLPISKLKNKFPYLFTGKRSFLFACLGFIDAIAFCLRHLMRLLEKFHLQSKWKAVNTRLHRYWYLRGWLDELNHKQGSVEGSLHFTKYKIPENTLEIDLKEGMETALKLLDQLRPDSIKIFYGKQIIGDIPFQPGAERLKGSHLRFILATELSESFIASLAIDELMSPRQAFA